jgi:LPXTG-site transpeptidase (sortase) family protein
MTELISSLTHRSHWLRACNNVLSGVVLLLAFWITFMPFVPSLQFWLKRTTHNYPALVKANSVTVTAAASAPKEVMPAENTLVIPSLDLQEAVYDGATAHTLAKGVWHRPHTSTPAAGSNTVLAGHRFTYSDPQGVFYNLDKVHLNDQIVLYWQGKKYRYSAKNIVIVKPTSVEIEASTPQPLLTIYTCTPLWSGRERLVIQAALMEDQ